MAVVNSGVYEVKLRGRYMDKDILNVFHYFRGGGLNDGSPILALKWDTAILASLLAIASDQLTYTSIEVEPIFGGDIGTTRVLSNANGGVTGAILPPHFAIPFKYFRSEKATRNGSKRFSGVTESMIDNGVFTPNFFIAMETAATALSGTITDAAGDFLPIILRRPDTEGFVNVTMSTVSDVAALNRVSTQNSRKNY